MRTAGARGRRRGRVALARTVPPAVRATYRLQLTPEFGFAEARELVPYLRDLGISHLYLSPSLQARSGSQHGYDVVDPRHISDALGGEDEFRELAGAGLGVILDIVPNHMAAVDENPFWRDLALRQMFFDVDLRTGFHRRFFDVSELGGVEAGGLGGLLGDACEGDRARARGRRRGRAGRPSGRSRESRRVLRPAAGRGRRARLGGEDPRAGRGAPGLAGGRDDRLRVPERRARACA